jgi:hypothetical protein
MSPENFFNIFLEGLQQANRFTRQGKLNCHPEKYLRMDEAFLLG